MNGEALWFTKGEWKRLESDFENYSTSTYLRPTELKGLLEYSTAGSWKFLEGFSRGICIGIVGYLQEHIEVKRRVHVMLESWRWTLRIFDCNYHNSDVSSMSLSSNISWNKFRLEGTWERLWVSWVRTLSNAVVGCYNRTIPLLDNAHFKHDGSW